MLTLVPPKNNISEELVRVKKYKNGKFFAAFFIFLLINLIFYQADCRYVISAKTRIDRYLDLPGLGKICRQPMRGNKNQIVLLGSSLFVQPLRALDKKLGEKLGMPFPDSYSYHGTADLNNKLKASNLVFNDVCSLAFNGAMVSDYFLLLNKYIHGKKHSPDLVFIDCSPRAFYDHGLVEADQTPLFNCLFGGNDLFLLADHYLPSFMSRFEFLAKSLIPLYGHGKWLTFSLNEYLHSILSNARAVLPIKLELETHLSGRTSRAKQPVANSTKCPVDQNMASSLREYREQHYAGISAQGIQKQMHFLDLLAQMCNKEHIKLTFLNMPLTIDNKNLLEPGFYYFYKKSVKTIAQQEGIKFLDLDGGGKYLPSDFDDSVHLNWQGGEKLENEIIECVRGHQSSILNF